MANAMCPPGGELPGEVAGAGAQRPPAPGPRLLRQAGQRPARPPAGRRCRLRPARPAERAAGSPRAGRYASGAMTQLVPPSPGAPSQRGDAMIWLYGIGSVVPTQITVAPGGPVSWGDPGGSGTFRISPRTGDRLTLSIYYDQHGHV